MGLDVGNPGVLAPFFNFQDSVIGAGSAVGTQICKPNAYRIALLLSTSNGSAIVRPYTSTGLTNGLNLPAGPNVLTLKFSDLGSVVGADWYLVASNVGTLYVGEVIYYPL